MSNQTSLSQSIREMNLNLPIGILGMLCTWADNMGHQGDKFMGSIFTLKQLEQITEDQYFELFALIPQQ